jgi:hypothetical protein
MRRAPLDFSKALMTLSTMSTLLSGWLPMAVSAASTSPWAPSNSVFMMSFASAIVGRRLVIIDSSRFVATNAGRVQAVGSPDDLLLVDGNVLEGDLPGEVATVDQDRVGGHDDPVHRSDARPALYLRNDVCVGPGQGSQVHDILGGAREGQRDVADAEPHAELERLQVLTAEGRKHGGRRHGYGPVRAHAPGLEHDGLCVFRVGIGDLEKCAVEIDGKEMADLEVAEGRGRPEGQLLGRAGDVMSYQTNGRSPLEDDSGRDHATAHLRSLRVEADGCGGVLPDELDGGADGIERRVREVEPEEVDVPLVEAANHLRLQGPGSERAEDARARAPVGGLSTPHVRHVRATLCLYGLRPHHGWP